MSVNLKHIDGWQVYTPTGWSDFVGIKRSKSSILFIIKFDDSTELRCTPNHLIKYTDSEFLEACHVVVGDDVFGGKVVIDKNYISGDFDVYDLIDVDLDSEYYTNGVVSHNCAFIPDIDEIWASAQMTLATGGNAIVLSTPNGVNKFHQIWQNAENGENADGLDRFTPIKLPWYLHPDRDGKWRAQQDVLLGKRMASQECDAEFLSSGHTVVDSDDIKYLTDNTIQEPIEKRGIGGDIWLWKYPDYNRSYVTTVDVSRGDAEDYSAFHVFDVESMEQVVEYKGKIDPQTLGHMVVAISTEYNTALLVIDNKNIGYSTVQIALDLKYKNLYYTYRHDAFLDEAIHLTKGYDLKNKEDMVPGFTISTKIRPILISKLEQYLRDRCVLIRGKRTVGELYVFVWLNGKAQAQRGYNDDLVIPLSMFFYVRDTALRLRQMGIELIRTSLSNVHRPIFKQKPMGADRWQMQVGSGERESLTWLLDKKR